MWLIQSRFDNSALTLILDKALCWRMLRKISLFVLSVLFTPKLEILSEQICDAYCLKLKVWDQLCSICPAYYLKSYLLFNFLMTRLVKIIITNYNKNKTFTQNSQLVNKKYKMLGLRSIVYNYRHGNCL